MLMADDGHLPVMGLSQPWDTPCHPLWTTTGTDVGTTSSDHVDGCGDVALRALIPEDDLHGHIEYKLRLPAQPSVDRMARLTSQLKWRLLEGGGVIVGVIDVETSPLMPCDDCRKPYTSSEYAIMDCCSESRTQRCPHPSRHCRQWQPISAH